MDGNRQAVSSSPGHLPFTTPTVGLFKQLMAIATGESADDLAAFVAFGGVSYELPDYAKLPDNPYICLKPNPTSRRIFSLNQEVR